MKALISTCVALASLMSCGEPPPWFCEGSGFKSVTSTDAYGPEQCQSFNRHAEASHRALIDSGIATEDEITAERAAFGVQVRDVPYWISPIGLQRESGFTSLEGIALSGQFMTLLVREEIHALELRRFHFDTGLHPGLDSSGFSALQDLLGYVNGEARWCRYRGTLTPSQRQGLIAAGWPVESWEQDSCTAHDTETDR